MYKSNCLFIAAVAGLISILPSRALIEPGVLLTLDITPTTTTSQFTLTVDALPGASLATNNADTSPSFTFSDGITLSNFFTGPAAFAFGNAASSTTLTTFLDQGAGALDYDTVEVDDISTNDSTNALDLSVYSSADTNDSIPEDFAAGTQAFALPGTLTAPLFAGVGGTRSAFAPVGTIGFIYAGYSGDYMSSDTDAINDAVNDDADPFENLVVLGEYEVIPEPSKWSLLLVGSVGLLALGRPRAVRASS